MAYYGYIRVSTKGQVPGTSLAEQEQQIKERYPTATIVKEAASGARERQAFDNLCKTLQAGDTLVVCKMDRFALFAEDNLEPNANYEVRTSEIYAHYKVWCEVNGCLPENSTNFKKSLQAIGTVVRKRPRDGSEKTTLLLGYRLK